MCAQRTMADLVSQYTELLITPLKELEDAYFSIGQTEEFRNEFTNILKNYIGRPTALTEVTNFAQLGLNGYF